MKPSFGEGSRRVTSWQTSPSRGQPRSRSASRPGSVESVEIEREQEYQPPPIAVPGMQPVRPSVVNNQPLTGWHRSVVLAGAIMSPFDAHVFHWPPDERAQPLRSRAEVQNWLVTRGEKADVINLFSFDPAVCLSDFPNTDGGPTPFGELPPSASTLLGDHQKYITRDFWVEEVSGYPIRRFFDFEGPASFRQRYSTYLMQFRRAVQDELAAAVTKLFELRKGEDGRRLERIRKLRQSYNPNDPGVFGLRGQFMSLECVNLLYQAAASRTQQELLESPHLAQPHSGCFSFRLFTPAFCARLVNETRHFEASCGGGGSGDIDDNKSVNSATSIASSENSYLGGNGGGSEGGGGGGGGGGGVTGGGLPKLGRPQASDGLVMRRGVLLEEMGLSEGFTDVLLARVIRPLARLLFPDHGGPSLDNHLAFALAQSPGTNSGRLFPKSYYRQVVSGLRKGGGSSSGRPGGSGGGGGGRAGMGGGGSGGMGDGPFELMEGNAEVMLVVCLSGGACGGDLVLYGPRDAPRPGGMAKVPLSRLEQTLDPAEAAAAAEAVAAEEAAAEVAAAIAAGEVDSGWSGADASSVGGGLSITGRDDGERQLISRGRTPERGDSSSNSARRNTTATANGRTGGLLSPASRRGLTRGLASSSSPSRNKTAGGGDRAQTSNVQPPPAPPQPLKGWESGVGPGLGGIGEAVLFSGDELHRFEALDQHQSGDRMLLIVWARSSAWRSEYRNCDDQRPIRDSSYLYL